MEKQKKEQLRKEAEAKINDLSGEIKGPLSEAEVQSLIHELRVHQIELEVQNEELNQSLGIQGELATKYRSLFQFAPVGYFSIDKYGMITEVNLAGAQMLGFSIKYLTGKSFYGFLPGNSLGTFKNFMTEIKMTGTREQCEVSINSEERQLMSVYIEGITLGGDNGILLSMVDISEMKDAEITLKKTNEKLKDTLTLKEKLLSVIGHDLKGPLTNILVFFNMFLNDIVKDADKKYEKYINEIIFDTEQALILLENLIAWSKLRTGVLQYNPGDVKISGLVNHIFELYSIAAARKNVRLVNKIAPDLVCNSDDFLISTLLRNLITNGIKFSSSGGIVEVDAICNHNSIEIITSDKGTGMSNEMINRIVSGKSAEQTFGTVNEPGSGFGLFLSRELVKLFGGQLWILSRINEGTSVHFTLPVAR